MVGRHLVDICRAIGMVKVGGEESPVRFGVRMSCVGWKPRPAMLRWWVDGHVGAFGSLMEMLCVLSKPGFGIEV